MGYWKNREFEPSYFRLSGLGEIFPIAETETIRPLPADWIQLYGRPLDLPATYDPDRDILWAVDTDEVRCGDGTAPCHDAEVIEAVKTVTDEADEAGHEYWHTVYVVETPATEIEPRRFITDVHVSLARQRSYEAEFERLLAEADYNAVSALQTEMQACAEPGFQWYYPQPGEVWRKIETRELYQVTSLTQQSVSATTDDTCFSTIVYWETRDRRGQELLREFIHDFRRVPRPEEGVSENWVYARAEAPASQ